MDTHINPKELRNAFGQYATGVTIITTRGADPDVFAGVTANSFSSVSLEPPLVLWSLAKNSLSLSIFQNAQYFAVNVLAADQVALSNHFARRQEDKFNGIAFDAGLGGCPLFDGCAAKFECKFLNSMDGGDHIIFLGQVERYANHGRDSLVFSQGKYAVSRLLPVNDLAELPVPPMSHSKHNGSVV